VHLFFIQASLSSTSIEMSSTAREETAMQKLWYIILLIAILTSAAWAQIPTGGNVFFGYSFERAPIVSADTTSLNGWDASLEGKFLPWIGLVADIDGHYGNHNYNGVTANITAHDALFGPRVSVSVKRFRPFAEFLVGVGHISRSRGVSDSSTAFANAAGGGLDYRILGPLTIRGQLDWVTNRFYSHTQNGVRFSTGVALHF
jgi:hypothetical protein